MISPGWGAETEETGELKLQSRMKQRRRGVGGGGKAITLSLLGQVARVTGLSCMSGAPVFNHRGDALLLFLPLPHHLPQICRAICQLPVQLAAESANKWVSEDLPAERPVITKVTLSDRAMGKQT